MVNIAESSTGFLYSNERDRHRDWDRDSEFSWVTVSEGLQSSASGSASASVNQHGNVVSDFQNSGAESKIIRLTLHNHQQEVEVDSSEESSPLGLTLRKTPSLVNLIETKLSQSDQDLSHNGSGSSSQEFVSQPMSEKLKASNFPATRLRIGKWERTAKNNADLVAKCYYAKRRLMWEMLEGDLKRKIEIQWSDILAIKATLNEDEPEILEIELNQPPAFYTEANTPPRKHTLWQQANDFTGGQAPIYRIHYVEFPAKTLEKHYDKLLQYDERLMMLSRKPFPSLQSPYFPDIYGLGRISFDFYGYRPQFPVAMQYPLSALPPPSLIPHSHMQTFGPAIVGHHSINGSTSPLSVMDFAAGDENANNYAFENQMNAFQVQGAYNTANLLANGNQIQLLASMAPPPQANPVFSPQLYMALNYGSGGGWTNSNHPITNVGDHLFGDSEASYSDGRTPPSTVYSWHSFPEVYSETNPQNNAGGNHLDGMGTQGSVGNVQSLDGMVTQGSVGNVQSLDGMVTQGSVGNVQSLDGMVTQGSVGNVQSIVSPGNHYSIDTALPLAQPIHYFHPQPDDNNLVTHMPSGNSSHPYVYSDRMANDSAEVRAFQQPRQWTWNDK